MKNIKIIFLTLALGLVTAACSNEAEERSEHPDENIEDVADLENGISEEEIEDKGAEDEEEAEEDDAKRPLNIYEASEYNQENFRISNIKQDLK